MAREHELEPGQDDLVKEDKPSTALRRVFKATKNAAPGRRGDDERIYADTDTGEPVANLQPKQSKLHQERLAQRQQRRAQKGKAPYEAPAQPAEMADAPAKQGRLSSLKQAWSDALSEAEAKQRAKRQSKGS